MTVRVVERLQATLNSVGVCAAGTSRALLICRVVLRGRALATLCSACIRDWALIFHSDRHLLLSTFHYPIDPVGQLIENLLAQRKLTAIKELAHLSIDEFDSICETALVVYVIAEIVKNTHVRPRNFTYNM